MRRKYRDLPAHVAREQEFLRASGGQEVAALILSGRLPYLVVLPEAGRDAQVKRWRVTLARTGGHKSPGANFTGPGLWPEGGYAVVHRKKAAEAGMVTHRGITHPAEYVDAGALRAVAETRFGFTAAQVRSVYRQGPLGSDARALRDRIDARILEIAESGGVLIELAKALGLKVTRDGRCPAIHGALRRARSRPRPIHPDDARLSGHRVDARPAMADVYNELATLAGDDGTAPFLKRDISRRLGRPESNVYRAVTNLQAAGLIELVQPATPLGPGRGSRPATYQVKNPQNLSPLKTKGATSSTQSPPVHEM